MGVASATALTIYLDIFNQASVASIEVFMASRVWLRVDPCDPWWEWPAPLHLYTDVDIEILEGHPPMPFPQVKE